MVKLKNIALTGFLILFMFLFQYCKREEFKWGNKVGNLTYAGNTVFLGPEELSLIRESTADRMVFSGTTVDLEEIVNNSIVVSGTSAKTPYGSLGRVNTVNVNGSEVSISFTDAALTDAVKDGTIIFHEKLLEKDFKLKSKVDGVLVEGPAKSFDGLAITLDSFGIFNDGTNIATIDGSIGISPEIDMTIIIESGIIKEINLVTTLTRIDELTVKSNGSFSGNREIVAAEFIHNPIVIDNLVFVPEITITCGFDGTVSGEVLSGVRQDRTITSNMHFKNGLWTQDPLAHTEDSDFMGPLINDNSDLKILSGINMSVKLFGNEVQAVKSTVSFSLETEITGSPLWRLLIGTEGINTIKGDKLGLAGDYSSGLMIEESEIADANDE